MNKYLILTLILFINIINGQKKKLKKLKSYSNLEMSKVLPIYLQITKIYSSRLTKKVLLQKIYLEAKIDQANGKFQSSYDKYKQYASLGGKDIGYDDQIIKLTSDIVNSAIEDNAENRYSDSAPKLYLAYTINPETNQDYLYYAAGNSVSGKDFDTALTYYNLLKDLKYEGISTRYFAKPAGEDEEVEFSESEYNVYKKTKQYTDFREETSESRYPEIIKKYCTDLRSKRRQ